MAFTGAEFSELRLNGRDWEKRPLQFFIGQSHRPWLAFMAQLVIPTKRRG
jgi:hypothetical protein